ncbi:unnamed protein product [Timema podura]|uniref:ARID domain-containing protein n=1 Tax=Timema podura TaxID=61482 RepID=A0ABN7P376_TIMPD|nr:unnamed protein product [Timema podura]
MNRRHREVYDTIMTLGQGRRSRLVEAERGHEHQGSTVVVLSFPRYCRYRGIIKRLEGIADKWLRNTLVVALGGFAVPRQNTRILFCRDTFDYPDLEGHELLCNHLAPNLKGRPRRKRKKRSLSPGGSESNESESSMSTVCSTARFKNNYESGIPGRNGLRCKLVQLRRSSRLVVSPEEKEFMVKLHGFMKIRRTPIDRVPHLGFKEIDLYAFYSKVQKLGGYDSVTTNRMWKPIYDDLGGHQGSTSAATYTRRHYERLLLPYELSVRDNRTKERRRAKHKPENKESVKSTNTYTVTPPVSTSVKEEPKTTITKEGGITSSLRSIRLKAADKFPSQDLANSTRPKDKENIPVSNVSEGITEVKLEASSENPATTKTVPELIDLASDQDSPVKVPKPPTPLFKKRKLEILKEGGLEVTAISSAISVPSRNTSPLTVTSDKRPSVIQHAMPTMQPLSSQVSITITPDLNHMLGSPLTDTPSTPSPAKSLESNNSPPELRPPSFTTRLNPPRWVPPRVTQSCSIYAHSESTVYGNPKDDIEPAISIYRKRNLARPMLLPPTRVLTKDIEVLDLTVKGTEKPAVSISRVPSAVNPVSNNLRNSPKYPVRNNGFSSFPFMDGKAVVGSNLEITVVDVTKSSAPTMTQRHPPSQHHQRKSIPTKLINRNASRSESERHTHQRNHISAATELIIPKPISSLTMNNRKNLNETSRNRMQQRPSQQLQTPQRAQTTQSSRAPSPNSNLFPLSNSPLFSSYLSQTSGTKSSPAFLPLLDPMYYSALYGQRMMGSNASSPFSPTMFPPTAEHLQLYKELMSHHNTLRLAQHPTMSGLLGLPRDGSISITPVGRSSTPTSK